MELVFPYSLSKNTFILIIWWELKKIKNTKIAKHLYFIFKSVKYMFFIL